MDQHHAIYDSPTCWCWVETVGQYPTLYQQFILIYSSLAPSRRSCKNFKQAVNAEIESSFFS